MRGRMFSAMTVSLILAACGGGPPAPAGLAYGLPDPPVVTYVRGDTATMDIDAGGQAMEARIGAEMTVKAEFQRADGGIQVSMELEDFKARMSNPAGAPVAADESGVDGALIFILDRQGHATLVDEPEVSGTARQFFEPLAMAHTFFPRVPGRGVQAGETWTDTVSFEGPQGDGEVSTMMERTYAVVGDTVVDGRSLVKISVEGVTDQSADGVIAGMDYVQDLSGTLEGWLLWDMARGVMVEQSTRGDLRGEMEVSAAPFPLGIRMKTRSHVKAQGL